MHSRVDRANGITRYRVRLGDEEIELPIGATLIGRDSSCRIKIFDSSISRRHARIQCEPEQAAIEDLGSRNGTRVNGVFVSARHILRAGDRIGIGTREMVVTLADRGSDQWEIRTGLLDTCSQCHTPYPAADGGCPRCGADVPSAVRHPTTGAERWSLGMLLEMLGKAMLTENVRDAERLMREVSAMLGDQARSYRAIDDDELNAIVAGAAWLDKGRKNASPEWTERIQQQLADLAETRRKEVAER